MCTSATGPDKRDDGMLALALLVLGLSVFIGFPLAAEDTAKPCIALQRHVLDGFAGVDDAEAAARSVSRRMQGSASFMGCTVRYWQDMLN